MRLLVVEDNEELADLLAKGLQNAGYEANGTVSVLDFGPGIAEDERHLIFQRFWRRDRRKAGSTGLGLSIVARIAELHSATVTLENRRPAGACFSLRFVPLGS
jgi:signal transduction histidine kinase